MRYISNKKGFFKALDIIIAIYNLKSYNYYFLSINLQFFDNSQFSTSVQDFQKQLYYIQLRIQFDFTIKIQ